MTGRLQLKTLSGRVVQPIGIGTWGFGGTWEPEPASDEASVASLRYSLSKGQNHIDSAELYAGGHTDEVVGQAIKGLNRQDLYIADKLWENSLAGGKVRPAVEAMLKKFGCDYLDALYIHKPWEDFPWREAIPQIDDLIDAGVVRQFGVSNFNQAQTVEAAGLSRHPVTLNQIHYNVINKANLDDGYRAYCAELGIQIVAYKPLERGAVAANQTLNAIAKAHRATPAQIALAWLVQGGLLPIPKASQPSNIDENIAAADISLSATEIDRLDKL